MEPYCHSSSVPSWRVMCDLFVRSEFFFQAVLPNFHVFWVVTPCLLVNSCGHFEASARIVGLLDLENEHTSVLRKFGKFTNDGG